MQEDCSRQFDHCSKIWELQNFSDLLDSVSIAYEVHGMC